MTIRVLLADDHTIIREGLKICLDRETDMEFVGQVDNGRDAVAEAKRLKPDVVVMDITMPDLNGVEATRQIVDRIPGVKVLGLSMHASSRHVAGMLKAGASGYLRKDCAFTDLIEAIRMVEGGRIYLSPGVADVMVDGYVSDGQPDESGARSVLTDREREVLQLVSEGKATKEIARDLHISVKTVETHRKHIMDKLGVHSVAKLTKYALREGLTSPEP